jgi:hypothetical protein
LTIRPPAALDHSRHQLLGELHGHADVEVKDGVEIVQVDRAQHRGPYEPDVVHQSVHRASRQDRFRRLHGGRPVGGADRLELPREGGRRGPRDPDGSVAAFGEDPAGRHPDPARRAGDHYPSRFHGHFCRHTSLICDESGGRRDGCQLRHDSPVLVDGRLDLPHATKIRSS